MVVAVDRPKVRELSTPEVYNPLVVLIAHLYLLRGQQVEAGDLRFQAGELEQELRSSYPWLSLEEVRIALDNGVKKKYGEYYGLNVITYLDWIKAYNESEARRKAKEEAEKSEEPKEEFTKSSDGEDDGSSDAKKNPFDYSPENNDGENPFDYNRPDDKK